MIYRYPRYGELFDAWQRENNSGSRNLFGAQEYRDLQMWSQLGWSDEVFAMASELGFEWAATDSGVLDRTLGHAAAVEGLYRPYQWQQQGRKLSVIFRDHFMSDLIGFVYSKIDANAAADDFLRRIR